MYSEYLLVVRFPHKRVIDRAIEAYTHSAWSRHCYLLSKSLLPGGGGSLLSGECHANPGITAVYPKRVLPLPETARAS